MPAPITATQEPHWMIHSNPGPTRGVNTYTISRRDLPDAGQVDLQMEHLVWAGALSPGDRLKRTGGGERDDVITVEEIPPSDTWQAPGHEKIYKRSGETVRVSRNDVEQEDKRGIESWVVDVRDEGWTPLTMMIERLMHYHLIIDMWREQKAAERESGES